MWTVGYYWNDNNDDDYDDNDDDGAGAVIQRSTVLMWNCRTRWLDRAYGAVCWYKTSGGSWQLAVVCAVVCAVECAVECMDPVVGSALGGTVKSSK